MNLRSITAIALAGLLSVGAVATVTAQDMNVYQEREKSMKTMGMNLQGMMKGEITDTVAGAEAIAGVFATLADLFPEGTNATPSKAKSEIWTDWAGFTAVIAKGQTASTMLVASATAGDADFGDKLKAVAGVCGECHQNYRNK